MGTCEHQSSHNVLETPRPMPTLDEDYVTVAEAATLLRVGPSTIRRWIREGDVPAYRIGRRCVALRRADLTHLITPARTGIETSGEVAGDQKGEPRRLTPEEKERALEAMDRLKELRKRIFEERGGKLFPPSWETINEMREERTRQLS
jgi:excisionase family DNA binding protein